MKRYTSLLFDVDGTLLDFEAAEEGGLSAVLSEYELPGSLSIADRMAVYRKVNRMLWDFYEQGVITNGQLAALRFKFVFQLLGIDADPLMAEKRYRDYLNSSAVPIPGVKEVLEYLQPKYGLYVVTNGFLNTQQQRLEASGLKRYFRNIFISEELGYQKPRKEFFDCCFLQMEGEKREDALIIGDSLKSDIRGGIDSGIDTCWFNPTKTAGDPTVTAGREIHSLLELKAFL